MRLSGEFHTLLADLSGNFAFQRTMRELSGLTCLIISLYDAPTTSACRADEHEKIIDALEKANLAMAIRLMLEHLDHIEKSLKLDLVDDVVDLEAVLREP